MTGRNSRRRLLAQDWAFVALLIAVAGLAGGVAWLTRVERDMTRNAANSISQTSRQAVSRIEGAVKVTAFAAPRDGDAANSRARIQEFIERYRKAKPDIALEFVDPDADPRRTREAGVQMNGELLVEHRGRVERLQPFNLTEQNFTNLLLRLARAGERRVYYLDGHGERRLDGVANHDLGEFGRKLADKGLKSASLNLAVAPQVPQDAAAVVVANPQVEVLPGEVDKLLAYVERGGALLWLLDPEPLNGLEPLAESLGLVLTPGVVVDPEARSLGVSPLWALGLPLPGHPVTQEFQLNTVFPMARRIEIADSRRWRATPLLEAAQRGWVETGKVDGRLEFDEGRDARGPVVVAVALEREVKDREQRVVVIGNGAFLANSYLGNAGNLDLGLTLVNWLSGDDRLVVVEPRPARDTRLALSRNAALAISLAFLVALPLSFAGAAGLRWWRRRGL